MRAEPRHSQYVYPDQMDRIFVFARIALQPLRSSIRDAPVNNVMNFPAQLSSLSPLAAWLAQQMAPLSVGEEWRFALDLAVCETATNIIRYALHEDRQRVFVSNLSQRKTG